MKAANAARKEKQDNLRLDQELQELIWEEESGPEFGKFWYALILFQAENWQF